MYIRYNEAIDFWEYDTSGAQNGSGPWVLLPVDITKLIGTLPPVPPAANVVLTDKANVFTNGNQTIEGSTTPGLRIVETGQPVNRKKWRISSYSGHLFIQPLSDDESVETDRGYDFDRTGVLGLHSLKLGTTGTVVDHLSEGVWTPAFSATTPPAGVGYARQIGRYTKIGKQVIGYFDIIVSSLGSGGSGELRINLPFAANGALYQACPLVYFGGINGGVISIDFLITPGASFGTFYYKSVVSSSTHDGALTWANIAVNTEFITSFNYVTN